MALIILLNDLKTKLQTLTMKIPTIQLPSTIRGRMTRSAYWARRKELRAAYKAQQANASNTQANQG